MHTSETIDAARDFFLQTDMTQPEIAQQLGIGERTLSRWISEGSWRKLKNAARYMPAQIVDNFQLQLTEIQEKIMSRPKGERFANEGEAAVMSRLVLCIARMKVEVSQTRSAQVLMNFIDLIYSRDPQLAVEITRIGHDFLKGPSKAGFHPYDMEYDTSLEDDQFESVCHPVCKEGSTSANISRTPSSQQQDQQEPSLLNNTSAAVSEFLWEPSLLDNTSAAVSEFQRESSLLNNTSAVISEFQREPSLLNNTSATVSEFLREPSLLNNTSATVSEFQREPSLSNNTSVAVSQAPSGQRQNLQEPSMNQSSHSANGNLSRQISFPNAKKWRWAPFCQTLPNPRPQRDPGHSRMIIPPK
jgi:hypothetical protein